jgi:hypothetical protein
MLSVKERQRELKIIGLYKGKIDGIEGTLTKKAYKDLQDKYFFRKEDKDGIYGNNTDILLQSVYNVKISCTNFDILKDKMYCRCKGKYCTGYPAIINLDLLRNLQSIRNKFGRTTVTSLLRCKKWNQLQGGVSTSKHLKGKAVDFRGLYTLTLNKRKKVINYWFTLLNPSYSYCNGFYKTSKKSGKKTSKTMGTSIHGDVKC